MAGRFSLVVSVYLLLFGSLEVIAREERTSWLYPILILITLLVLFWSFSEYIYAIIGVHHRIVLWSTSLTLFCLLSGAPARAAGSISSFVGIFVAAIAAFFYCRRNGESEKFAEQKGAKGMAERQEPKMEASNMSDRIDDLERARFDLERERLSWQKTQSKLENRFFNRNVGAIITAIVSIAAVTVSYLQLKISSDNARDQLETERLRNDRQFYLEAAKFILDPQQVSSTDKNKALHLKNVVLSGLPPELAFQVALRMRQNASTIEIQKIWEDAVTTAIRAAKSGATQCAPGDSACVRKFLLQCDSVCVRDLLSQAPGR